MDAVPYPTDVTEVPPGLDPRIRRFRCGDEVDTFVVATRRSLVIVDTHSTPALALRLAEQCVGPGDAGRLIVVNTHADYDHAWEIRSSADRAQCTRRRSSVTCSAPSD